HTFVNGLSDVDSLFVLKGEDFRQRTPIQAIDYIFAGIHAQFPNLDIQRHELGLVVKNANGFDIEILPAIRLENKLHIPSEDGSTWSKIRPEAFFRKLSEVNQANGQKVVPVIKLVKGINSQFSSEHQLSGYHIESLSIRVFEQYDGPQNLKAMLQHF